MQEELTIDITILYVGGSNKIRVQFPERTRRLWRALTGKTRYYLATPTVQDCILEENPRVLGEWTKAQEVLERLSYMPGSHQVSLDDAIEHSQEWQFAKLQPRAFVRCKNILIEKALWGTEYEGHSHPDDLLNAFREAARRRHQQHVAHIHRN